MKSLLYPVPGNRSVYSIAKFQMLCLGVKQDSSLQIFPVFLRVSLYPAFTSKETGETKHKYF